MPAAPVPGPGSAAAEELPSPSDPELASVQGLRGQALHHSARRRRQPPAQAAAPGGDPREPLWNALDDLRIVVAAIARVPGSDPVRVYTAVAGEITGLADSLRDA